MVVMMVMVMNMRRGEDDQQLLKGTNCRELVVAPSLQPVMMNMVIVMDMMLKIMVTKMKMMNMMVKIIVMVMKMMVKMTNN